MFLNGRKLKGGWTLLRTRGQGPRSQWLFLKRRDGLERPGVDITREEERSVMSGLSIADLERGLLPEWRASQLRPTAEHVAGARRRVMLTSEELPSDSAARVVAVLDRGHVTLSPHRDELDGDLARALAAQPVDQAVLVGQLEATTSGRQLLARDLLYLDGFDLRTSAPAARHELLHAALAPLDGVEVAPP
jgi:hypothetical protein